jgi:hypothetical protein
MLYTIYTRYLNEEPVCHGTIECNDENTATIYAYHRACDVFSQHADDYGIASFEEFHDALFSTVEFWIE